MLYFGQTINVTNSCVRRTIVNFVIMNQREKIFKGMRYKQNNAYFQIMLTEKIMKY